MATKLTQGQRSNDFCHTPEGELVRRAFVCEKCAELNDPDYEWCGCNRSFEGFHSPSTTTAKVAYIDLTKEEYIDKYLETNPFSDLYE